MSDDKLVEHMTKLIAAGLDQIEALTVERDRLRLYVVYDDDCTINRYPSAGACSCGLRAAHD